MFENMKSGLLGGHLGVANVGAYTSGDINKGFELVAFSPVPPNEPGGVPPPFTPSPSPPSPPPQPWACDKFNASAEAWIEECVKLGGDGVHCQMQRCESDAHVWTAGQNAEYPGCGTCWCCKRAPATPPAGPLPRLSNINYNPGVFVMLRDSDAAAKAGSVNGSRYFYATNSTTKELLPPQEGASLFYSALHAVYEKDTKLLKPGMQIELPATDQRQADMARAALLATTNNFVGNQPNYGFGSTYWSYGREDNGSLPLDMLSVDDALISWGICDTALEHVAFYFDNYIAADGTVVYNIPPWTHQGDSIADYGRLIDIFLRAVQFCHPPLAWQQRHLPTVQKIGQLLLRLRSRAPPPSPPGPKPACAYSAEIRNAYIAGESSGGTADNLATAMRQCSAVPDCGGVTQQYGRYECRRQRTAQPNPSLKPPANSWLITNPEQCHAGSTSPVVVGLIVGAPEHDFSGDTTHYYYNNNVWSLAGMERLGVFLSSTRIPGANTTLAAALLADAGRFRADLMRSFSLASVTNASTSKFPFVPAFAVVNASPPTNMHADRASSYANFRFYSEPMLTGTDVVPPDVQQGWLELHNEKGGRLGGASRFMDHLDDMPTAGWGYGALANNRTADFQALLYGHMATYQSSGSFHSTEQLVFTNDNERYRGLGSVPDPAPPPSDGPTRAVGRGAIRLGESSIPRSLRTGPNLRYNGAETLVSFCIVSNILVSRMTRWQLIMEDASMIWLGRGAPRRWFRATEGFNVTNAPSSAGPVSYRVSVHADSTNIATRAHSSATYSVSMAEGGPAVPFVLRWPGPIDEAGVVCSGGDCQVTAVDEALGLVQVRAVSPFSVSATWAA